MQIKRVINDLEQARNVATPAPIPTSTPESSTTTTPVPEPVAQPCGTPCETPCVGNACGHLLIRRARKKRQNQKVLKSIPDNTAQSNNPGQNKVDNDARFQDKIFRFVPMYTHRNEVSTSDHKYNEVKLKQQREELAKQLADEFDNQLQSERERILNMKKAASFPVRVGYKAQGGTL